MMKFSSEIIYRLSVHAFRSFPQEMQRRYVPMHPRSFDLRYSHGSQQCRPIMQRSLRGIRTSSGFGQGGGGDAGIAPLVLG